MEWLPPAIILALLVYRREWPRVPKLVVTGDQVDLSRYRDEVRDGNRAFRLYNPDVATATEFLSKRIFAECVKHDRIPVCQLRRALKF
jgi:hypothetical protein